MFKKTHKCNGFFCIDFIHRSTSSHLFLCLQVAVIIHLLISNGSLFVFLSKVAIILNLNALSTSCQKKFSLTSCVIILVIFKNFKGSLENISKKIELILSSSLKSKFIYVWTQCYQFLLSQYIGVKWKVVWFAFLHRIREGWEINTNTNMQIFFSLKPLHLKRWKSSFSISAHLKVPFRSSYGTNTHID